VTAGGGLYQFANVPETTLGYPLYRVQVLPVNFTSGSTGARPLYGADSSSADAANFAADGRDQGIGTAATATTGVWTQPIDLLSVGASAAANIDFGFVAKVTSTVPDLVVTKSASAPTVARGGQVTYPLQASNAVGTGTLTRNATVLDTLPAGMTAVLPVSATGWNCAASTTARVSCTYNGSLPLAGGNTIGSPINVLVNVGGSTPLGSVTNTATITKLSGEPSFTNNTATAVVTVQ
jgi:uncharacterized repeat protein (TIGR01451 family)